MTMEKYGVADVKQLQKMELLDVQERLRKLADESIADLEKRAAHDQEVAQLEQRAAELQRELAAASFDQ
jgi:predicted nuclease with TOPRIM domain